MGNLTRNFDVEEFEEEGCDVRIDPFLPKLCQAIRTALGQPVYVTSGVRSPEHNERVGGQPNSSHLRGLAVDISDNDRGKPISSRFRHVVLQTLLQLSVGRIGLADTFIHFDVDKEKAQDVIWVY